MAINLQAISRNTSIQPPRIMVYGPHGLGKTTFGASAPAPIFILTEDGLGRLEVDHFPLPRLTRMFRRRWRHSKASTTFQRS